MVCYSKCKVQQQGQHYPSSTDWGLTILKAALPKDKKPKIQINKPINLGGISQQKIEHEAVGHLN